MTQTLYPSLAAMPAAGVTGDVKVAPGSYTPNSATPLQGNVTVDLRDVNVPTVSGGSLFKVTPGCQAVIRLGGEFDPLFQNFDGGLTSIIDATLNDGDAPATVILVRPSGYVRAIHFQKTQGGIANVIVLEPNLTVGSGLRAVADIMLTVGGRINGGLQQPSASPAGIHSLDDNAGTVAKPGTICGAFGTDLSGYLNTDPTKFQGDSALAETRVHTFIVSNCKGGGNTDSGMADSKAAHSEVSNCTIDSIGDRAVSSHYGEMVCFKNKIVQQPTSPSGGQGKAYQGSGKLVARGDTVTLVGAARLAVSNFVASPGSGPASTYPRVGDLAIHGDTDSTGAAVTGPVLASPGQGYTPTVVAD